MGQPIVLVSYSIDLRESLSLGSALPISAYLACRLPGSPCLPSISLCGFGIADMDYCVWLYVGSGNLNPHPHAWKARTFHTKLSPHNFLNIYQERGLLKSSAVIVDLYSFFLFLMCFNSLSLYNYLFTMATFCHLIIKNSHFLCFTLIPISIFLLSETYSRHHLSF